jgi:hypothetical protein
LIVVVRKAFLSCDLATPNDPCLQVGDHEIDFVGRQHSGRRLQIFWPDAREASVTFPRRVCAVFKRRHTSSDASASDSRLESHGIELGPAQIRPDREIVVLTISIRERAMAIDTPSCLWANVIVAHAKTATANITKATAAP